MNPNAPITESIDERILKLIGLEETFDIDYGTYIQLLRERLIRVTAGEENLPDEDFTLLRDELKRVKLKEREKTVRIKPEKLLNKKSVAPTAKISTRKLLPPSTGALVKQPDIKQESKEQRKQDGILVRIDEKVGSILETLISLNKLQDKKIQTDRKERENKKREEKENRLEKGRKMITGAVQKMIAPFQNILDRIWKFIYFTLLGRAFTMLMNWFADPKNKKKVEVLGRFLKDWWPALLAAFALFMTPFGGFVRGIVGIVAGFSGRLIKIIPQLLNIVKGLGRVAPIISNPAVLFPAAVTAGAIGANEITGQRKAASVQAENKARAQTGRGLGVQGTDTMGTKVPSVGNMGPTTPYGLLQGAKRGAVIQPGFGYGGIDKNTGTSITGAGPDTQLIAARPGEVVLTPEDQKVIYKKTGFDVGGYVKNRTPSFIKTSNIRISGKTPLMNIGGIVGFNKGGVVGGAPTINVPDYHSLLAIAALEADNPQGRSDVAQSIYNRLFAAKNYSVNFNQDQNTIKNIIAAPGQYEPTFKNRGDWLGIKDLQSAATAIMNSPKGIKNKWSMKEAIAQLRETEAALKNTAFQSKSQKHVGGRAYFLGTSQHKNMKSGDVLRGEKDNFFSPWYLEGTQYDKERRNIAAPIPNMLLPKASIQKKSPKQPNLLQRISSGIMGLFSSPAKAKTGMQGGGFVNLGLGMIKENTGMKSPSYNGSADRRQVLHQPLSIQPGEFDLRLIIPRDAVDNGAVPLIKNTINHIIADKDSNSNSAKLGLGNKTTNVPQITPYSTDSVTSMITLPPIKQSVGNMQVPSSPTGVPVFSAIPSDSSALSTRKSYADMYGLVG